MLVLSRQGFLKFGTNCFFLNLYISSASNPTRLQEREPNGNENFGYTVAAMGSKLLAKFWFHADSRTDSWQAGCRLWSQNEPWWQSRSCENGLFCRVCIQSFQPQPQSASTSYPAVKNYPFVWPILSHSSCHACLTEFYSQYTWLDPYKCTSAHKAFRRDQTINWEVFTQS